MVKSGQWMAEFAARVEMLVKRLQLNKEKQSKEAEKNLFKVFPWNNINDLVVLVCSVVPSTLDHDSKLVSVPEEKKHFLTKKVKVSLFISLFLCYYFPSFFPLELV